ncbi:ROK family protein [uncultured Limosilactobacillus sp.]|uniref:ROK family protein n=1 Tax=uncultured Limosilactobacillus sp. TaxID=2837629 RepID=UPI0025D5A351|nr:ROK family protein [uncultured Limosilactobacillus sp.]
MNYLAFDVGGTSIKYGIIDSNFQVIKSGQRPTDHNHDQAIIKTLTSVSHQLMSQLSIQGIGISTAGRVGDHGEIIYAGPTIQEYQGTQLKRILEQTTHLPVHVMNDVDAALMGEVLHGSVNRQQSTYCIALGTGIGGAFYTNGQLFKGAHGLANSVGYLNYDPDSQETFESQSSTLAIQHQLAAVNVTVPEAFQLARDGKTKYVQIIQNWCQRLGRQLAQICLILDPTQILIGGAVSQQGDFLIHQIQTAVHEFLPAGLDNVEIKATTLQDRAQLFGAVSPFFL